MKVNTRLRKLAASVFGVDINEVPEQLCFGQIAQWDSMGHINFIFAIEEEFCVRFSSSEIGSLKNLELIERALDSSR